ncbi:MAG: type II toxin-antitoxin system Phd/YefM family antitoxin [Spirochaetales bacterium]|nr:type II toxin-antitoxin system Phd/YefM family antitoxin [Spirochaetales bacterium]
MKVISVMKVRKSLGEILDEVNLKSETFILERAGKPIAMLSPLHSLKESDSHKLSLKALRDLKGLNPHTERSGNPSEWLEREREDWS